MVSTQLVYNIILIVIFIENMVVGNFVALKEREISSQLLPTIFKIFLFPFFYIVRVTYAVCIFQLVNIVMFAIMFIICNLRTSLVDNVVSVYLIFQICYHIASLVFFCVRLFIIKLQYIYKSGRIGESWLLNILDTLGAQECNIDGHKIYIKEPEIIKSYAFIILSENDKYIPQLYVKDILNSLLDMGCLLICIKEFSIDNTSLYADLANRTIMQYNEIDKDKKQIYFVGCETTGLLFVSWISYMTSLPAKNIFICRTNLKLVEKSLKDKKTEHLLKKYYEIELYKAVACNENETCIVGIFERHSYDKLRTFLSL